MTYLSLLELLKRIAKVDPTKIAPAVAIIVMIAQQFGLLIELFKGKAQLIMNQGPFLGNAEFEAEKELEAMILGSVVTSDDDKILIRAGRFDFAKLREIWLALKQAGIADVLIAVLTRLLIAV